MSNNVNNVPRSKCTGCSACLNMCPVDAISMQPDCEGFIMPVVDESKCVNCGKCLNQCPAMNDKYKNNEKPELYAAMADNEVRAVSSSGGMFSLAASIIFEQGGYVCGAAFDDNFVLAHRLIDSEDEMPALRRSKYLQSNINTVYRDIKKILNDNKPVLFAGTPCQVAGLRAYLNKDYDNLYTMDILCHGVPSQQMFSKYLEYIAGKNATDKNKLPKPVSINFRDKEHFGWTSAAIRIEFDNGRVYEGTLKDKDPYEFVFLRNVGLRKSCENCPFSAFPRPGDLSVGDFWGISRFDKTMTDQKGTSLVYVNSEQGKKLFAEMQKKCIKVKEMHINSDEIRNRIRAACPSNKNRGRFLKMVQNNSFEESIKNVRNNHFDIGLVSNFYAGNFGGALTQYALYHVLEDFGYSTLMIERPKTAKGADRIVHNLEKIFIEKPYPEYAIAPQYKDKNAMRALNNQCDTFVVGSDQLFQYALFRVLGEFVTLDWVNDDKKKIAYAASYGHDDIWGDQKVHSEMAYFMQKFDAFSVREESGVRISKEHYGVDAEWVLDPVFLCDPKHYHALADKATREIIPHFIGGYILDPTEEKQRIFKHAMEKMSLPCEIFSEYNCSAEYIAPLGDLNVPNLKTEERLKDIINCDFFITDSFHGTCFAIIMKKPFISILNKGRGASRFKSLLSMLHLEHRLIESEEDLSRPDLFTPIDYDAVYEILDKEKDRCRKWLLDALKAPKLKSYSDYDMMVKLIEQQSKRIDSLEKLLLNIAGNISDNISDKTDILDYLDVLNKQKKDNLIIISVKDTPGLNLDSFIAQKLNALGLKTNLEGKHGHSYVAVIDDGNVIYENLGENLEPSVYQAKVGGHNLMITSRVYKNGNESVISIDNKDYSVNQRGLNIVVCNKASGYVIDSVSFDTHVKDCTCQRKG